MQTPLGKFQSLLRELFQFEHADLDFGVYRIMNLRRERMEKWLNDELPKRARQILEIAEKTADDGLLDRLAILKSQLVDMDPGGIDEDGAIVNEALKGIAKGREYSKLKAIADKCAPRGGEEMEAQTYNHLYDFFSRYYDSGDFIPKRRRSFAADGRDTYAIPWDGEEVVLHWANKDQYYIKTGERFTHYRWQANAGGRSFTIEFRLTDADLPANNNKDTKKKFNLLVADKVQWSEVTATLMLPFHYRGLTPEEESQLTGKLEAKLRESVIARTIKTLNEHPTVACVQELALAMMAPTRDAARREVRDKDGNVVPLLRHHLNRWAVKNESDFFIHKDLRRFLSGELDYFLKSVVLNLDNLLAAGEQRAEPTFRLLDAVKRLGAEIIDFVSQLEDFQKSLFEKKKFVLETSWCLTLDRIPANIKEEVYAAILANDRQWEEWEDLYKISKWPVDLVTPKPYTRQMLETYPSLMLDTGLKNADKCSAYDPFLVERILAGIENIDERIDGTIIHSDNYHALGFLRAKYHGAMKSVYADPPYNTDAGPICYKNGYRSSTWVSMIENRLAGARALMSDDGVICITIDDYQVNELAYLLDCVFGRENQLGVAVIRNNPSGRSTVKGFSICHEYAFFYRAHENAVLSRFPRTEKQLARFTQEDGAHVDWRNFRKDGGAVTHRSLRPKQFYPIFVKVAERNLRIPRMNWNKEQQTWNLLEQPAADEVVIWPRDEKGRDRVWSLNHISAAMQIGDLEVRVSKDGGVQIHRRHTPSDGVLPRSWWDKNVYAAREHGSSTLTNLFGESAAFSFAKSPFAVQDCVWVTGLTLASDECVLDFFGGSGTTAHAVIGLNRSDEGNRKYILIEMADYFDTVLKPRLQKVVFSEDWNDRIPKPLAIPKDASNPYNGVSHCLKVLRLESYEDALDNIEFDTTAVPGEKLGLDFRRDYELRYALDWESKDCPTRLAVEQLDSPFDYTLTLRRETGTVTVKPDLPETFAYLIGLHTRRRFRTEREGVSYLIYTGTLHEDGTEVAVLWRTCRGWTEAQLKLEADWWRAQHETLAPAATRIYVNGASAIEGHHSLDAEFKSRMHGGGVS